MNSDEYYLNVGEIVPFLIGGRPPTSNTVPPIHLLLFQSDVILADVVDVVVIVVSEANSCGGIAYIPIG